MTTARTTPVDLSAPPAEPPAGCEDELMWRTAYRLLTEHEPNPCPACAEEKRCEARWLAESGLATAMGELRLMSDYWRGLMVQRRAAVASVPGRRRFDMDWLALPFEQETVAGLLGRRDIGKLFRLLKARGWSRQQISSGSTISESGVRAIAQGKRQVVSYDVLKRICDGMGIPPTLMGLSSEASQ